VYISVPLIFLSMDVQIFRNFFSRRLNAPWEGLEKGIRLPRAENHFPFENPS
jgi:hypothetical protein